MSTLFQPTALVGAIAIAMGFSTTAYAQQTSEATVNATLETLVVTASRTEEKIKDVPARISVIDQNSIERNPIFNLSDEVQKDPSIFMKQYGGLGQTTDISIRGTKSNHTLVLKDGARLNSQNHFSALFPTFIDTSDIKQIEILKGPASVQYGTDAIGGVVQMITTTPSKNSGFITGIYAENKTYKTIAGADLVQDNFYAQIRGQRLETDGTRILDHQNKNQKASYNQKGYSAKVGYDNKDALKANISISENEGGNQFYDWKTRQNHAKRFFENRLINSNIEYDLHDDLTLSARFSNFVDNQNVKDSEPDHFDTENNEGDLNLRWSLTPQQNILLGSTYLKSDFKSNSIKNTKQNIDSVGYYLQHQHKSEKLNTQVGIRTEDNELFGTHTVGQGAIRYQVLPTTSIYANIGSAFKTPSLTELYYFVEGSYPTYGNPDLKPEKSISYEIGLDQKINNHLTAYLSTYHTNIKNLIVTDYLGQNKSSFTNLDKSEVNGGELGFKWKNQDLFFTTEYAYADSKNKKTNNNIAYRPKQTFTLSTGIENASYGVSASLITRSDIYADNANKVKAPGYATVDLNMYWNINPNIKVFSNIQNIGDVDYKIADNFGDGWYVNSGRLASAGVTFKY
ncbi:TonB-dependent receptor [Acinetobacter sp. ANC 5378]|uniref:TonB-dependent receptor plug domain-containing protein n=1 Tax=Acinetobacter sp. ANC 5378 TaxID=2731249 RepID=UPI00148FC276|nr:TonB-dependent receptor [Acinetobacter sp. ANC 5378]NNG82352.1 TonB-dependent receptor [Acinetobacter sp. ANC 5378]